MQAISPDNIIRENDIVVVSIGPDIRIERICDGKKINCRYGEVLHSQIIGHQYGSRLRVNEKNNIFLLRPNPYFWTLGLRHVTQILYHSDISQILFRLNIIKNKVVVEAGMTLLTRYRKHVINFLYSMCNKTSRPPLYLRIPGGSL
ncbi:tRNA (adenine(58)-N(1))-methyltransferase catalytic subunit TRM61 [Thelohanellus kitauei]|uniref:tRNA (adenine(58)-N(1))-methyltransferase n=1 Tax=Thelohanellus kitauei TaxID=669202 RepID=A0A0C2MYT7_THEKT|nr:tRNA (adenine(58)-N(1))-methyltransferase catalytic subunit TRM61 [Thelohanellus kitauei]